MRHETLNTRLETVEECVKPIAVMSSDLSVIKRIVGIIAVGMISTMFAFIWQVILASHKG